MANEFEELRTLIAGGGTGKPPPPPPTSGVERIRRSMADPELRDFLMRRDPNVARTGIGSMSLRYGLSIADTPEERAAFLDRAVGQGQWTQDMFGRYALLPEAAARFGVTSDKPVTIDEPGLTMGDLADIGGSAPGMVGSMVGAGKGAAIGAPMGPLGVAGGAIGGAAIGGAAGRSAQEIAEQLAGVNLQAPGQVYGDVGDEAMRALAGEAAFQGVLRPIGRKLLAPHAGRMTNPARELVTEAGDIGARPAATAVTGAPIMGRVQSMVDTIFGDPRVVRNAEALTREVEGLKSSVGPKLLRASEPGTLVKSTIMRSRKALSRWGNSVYGRLSQATNNAPIVPTAGIRAAAQEMLEKMPTTEGGKIILIDSATRQRLLDITKLPERISFDQAQGMRGFLWEAVEDRTLLPGTSSGMAKKLYGEVTKAFDDVVTDPAMQRQLGGDTFGDVLKRINARYKARANQFDDALIARIARDPKIAGAIEPELVVQSVFKPKHASAVTRVMSLMKQGTKVRVRRAAMEELMDSFIKRSDDPLVGEVFDGTRLLNKLDTFGDETLTAMFGEATKNRLYRLGRVAQFASKKPGQSGGLVAANIALHPLRNLPKLVQLNLLSKFLESDVGFRWATEGLRAPGTRAGAAALSRMATRLAAMADQHTEEQQ